ncbi:MAG TPA: DUF1223 domain-containing protein [Puia sp.]|nr:DUF1223 domain-containing protein [Puia sp.]
MEEYMLCVIKKNIEFIGLLIIQVLISSYTKDSAIKRHVPVPEGFALVELFTSEGCSSCPPADEAVGRLHGWKKNVYILSFHVDYWNYLGWKDVFSNSAYSTRQQNYGDLFHLSSIYTPQIVVNGSVQFVGSDEARLRATIENDLKEIQKADLQIKIHAGNKNQLAVLWTTNPNAELKINIALVQNFTKDHIERGENKGQTLNHYFTVRDFESSSVNTGTNTTYLNIPAGLQPSDCSVIAFLQNPKTGVIEAATQLSVEARN